MATVPLESTDHAFDAARSPSQLQLELANSRGGTYANIDVFRKTSNQDEKVLGLTDLKIDGLDDQKPVLLAQNRPNHTPEASLQRQREISDKGHAPTEHQLVEKKVAELHQKYGVDFSKNGETVKLNDPPGVVALREPNLRDLKAIEEALKKNPSGVSEPVGSPGVKFYFLEKDVDPKLYAFFDTAEGRNAIFVQPALEKLEYATNKEAPAASPTMEALLAHELEHNATAIEHGAIRSHAFPLPREFGDNKTLAERPVDAAMERDYGQLGWTRLKLDNNDVWAMQGNDGLLYVQVKTEDGEHGWVPVNKQGKFLNEDGKPVKPGEEVEAYDDNYMRFKAKVAPITNYFPNPEEMLAEGMAYYHSQEKRAWLIGHNREVYEICKRKDQERINRRYGTSANGQPNYVRDINGEIVPHNSANLAKIHAFEENARKRH